MLIHFDTFSMHLVFICTVKNFWPLSFANTVLNNDNCVVI
jgi:hypothetical protein